MDLAYQRTGTVNIEDGKTGIQWDGGETVYEYPGDTAVVQVSWRSIAPQSDPAVEIENAVAPRPAEARAIKVIDQATLDAVGERLAANKALQKEADRIFDPVIATGLAAHRAAIAAKRKVTDPLTQEETILKGAAQGYILEQRRIADEAEHKAREVREAEERRLLAEAEQRRQEEQARINAALALEHAEEVERALVDAEQSGASQEEIAAICETPAPEPVVIPLDIPVFAPAKAVVPAVSLPKGMSVATTYTAEVTNWTLLARAIGEGKVPASYGEPVMKNLNARARADGPAMNIPGVKVVPVARTAQRSR